MQKSEVPRAEARRGCEERRLTMEVEFTARQVVISKALRAQAEEGMERIGRILGKDAHSSIIFSTQKNVQIVELTVRARQLKIAATGRAEMTDAALREAMERAESQAVRYRDRRIEGKRLPKEEKIVTAPPVTRSKARTVAPAGEEGEEQPAKSGGKAGAAIAVHSFPARAAVVQPHILKNGEAIALKPMTLEEAVKDTEFRDRDLLIFHNPAGDMFVLHRRRDGQMELVELP